MDHIIASQGDQLTTEELVQLADIVQCQIRYRSSLNQGDLVFDKGKAAYEARWYDYKQHQTIRRKLTDAEALEALKTGKVDGSWCKTYIVKSGGKQDKFIRMLAKRARHVLEPLELMQKMFSTAIIDVPAAKDVVESIENETAKVRAVFEKKAEDLLKLIEKNNNKVRV